MNALLAPDNLPFAVALALLVLIVAVQATGLFPDADADADVPVDTPDGAGASLMALLGIGRVPLLVWLAILLGSFSAGGLALQSVVQSWTGAPLSAGWAGLAGLGIALPATAFLSWPIGRIWPRDETDAVDVASLVGRRGVIAIGTARRGAPARASVPDPVGTVHHVMVEPHHDGDAFAAGDEVHIVRREGETFFVIGAGGPTLLSTLPS